MKLISHRGNLYGPNLEKENQPQYIMKALASGYDVEIDVWFIDGIVYLGHDKPQYEVERNFIMDERLWCHAKNLDALHFMLKYNTINCFWHQNDDRTITSKGYIWTYPNKEVTNKSVVVVLNETIPTQYDKNELYGTCGDYVANW
jgi:hypothetical protein